MEKNNIPYNNDLQHSKNYFFFSYIWKILNWRISRKNEILEIFLKKAGLRFKTGFNSDFFKILNFHKVLKQLKAHTIFIETCQGKPLKLTKNLPTFLLLWPEISNLKHPNTLIFDNIVSGEKIWYLSFFYMKRAYLHCGNC